MLQMFLTKKYSITEYIKYSGLMSSFRDNVLIKEAVIVLSYFLIYMTYSFIFPGLDYLHWLTLVLIPFGMLYLIQRKNLISPSFKLSLAFFGLRKNNLSNGIAAALMIGFFVSAIQIAASDNVGVVWQLVNSGEIFYLLPISFFFLIFSVGFTEEFFFRGVLQTRISRLVNSNIFGIVSTSFLYGVYSIPYYYIISSNTNFFSGDLDFLFIFGGSFITGLILGYVYLKSNENLLSCILLRSSIQILPMLMVIKSSWF